MNSDQIRKLFLSFFEGKGHLIIPSSSLVPVGDPTLLFTSAGMVQMKPYFLGEATPPGPRLTSCQKCFRTTDIEAIGDTSHLTFFEMLGNFSVGDYFKREAIAWAWEFVTQKLNLPAERLWATIFLDDEEAFGYWQEVGVPPERIRRFGEKDNFWGPAGEEGPCGPCSEIHYDLGPEYGCGRDSCGPNCDCGRFLEIWNLVFMQYNQDRQGKRTPLPRPNIDTGLGLERTAAVMQGKRSLYDTDLFLPLIHQVEQLSGYSYGQEPERDRALRVVAEHSRGLAFLMADGVLPSNEGRGYVLRRLLRRAQLFGRRLGLDKPFLAQVAEGVIDQMGDLYPELRRNAPSMLRLIREEEERFQRTLQKGISLSEGTLFPFRLKTKEIVSELPVLIAESWANFPTLDAVNLAEEDVVGTLRGTLHRLLVAWDEMELSTREGGALVTHNVMGPIERMLKEFEAKLSTRQLRSRKTIDQEANRIAEAAKKICNTISGQEVFILYDTFGFPKELTAEMAAERGFSLDETGFEQEMAAQRERARAAHKFGLGTREESYQKPGIALTPYLGHEALQASSVILGLLVEGQSVDRASQGQEVEIVLTETPFYAEMGGQVGDTWIIQGPQGQAQVTDTFSPLPHLIVHRGRVSQGQLSEGERVTADVDRERRGDIARNHTATHLLQRALRQVLGEHVFQRGSLVAPDRLRFDFSHPSPLTPEESEQVQQLVNQKIRENLPVRAWELNYKEALERGAIALFGEKYGERVRMMEVGDFSRELCGGSHIRATGELGFFYIVSAASIGAGLRRLEAVTGRGAEAYVREQLSLMASKVTSLQTELEQSQKRVLTLERDLERGRLKKVAESLAAQARPLPVNPEVRIVSGEVNVSSGEALRELSDWAQDIIRSGFVVLWAVIEGKPQFVVRSSPDLSERCPAGRIAKTLAQRAGGSGGGSPRMGQGGGRDRKGMKLALDAITSEQIIMELWRA